jgi:hypothetical protein
MTKVRGSGNSLALVPVVVAALLWVVAVPRAVEPEGIPRPSIRADLLQDIVWRDNQWASEALRNELPYPVREVGTNLRAFHTLQQNPNAIASDLANAREKVTLSFASALVGSGAEPLLRLRALQLRKFVDEVRRFEQTGTDGAELQAVGGNFVARMRQVGWLKGTHLRLTDDEMRVVFKAVWNADVGATEASGFALALDEQRTLFSLRFRIPHPSENADGVLEGVRLAARDPEDCQRYAGRWRTETSKWLEGQIRKFAVIDPTYPADYALGIALYGQGDYLRAALSFRQWLEQHPSGSYTYRARNFLKASLDKGEADGE